jgi:hypothetical protein
MKVTKISKLQAVQRKMGVNDQQWHDLLFDLGFWYLESRKLPIDAQQQLKADNRFWLWLKHLVSISTEQFCARIAHLETIPVTFWWDHQKVTLNTYSVNEAILRQVGNNFEHWHKQATETVAEAHKAKELSDIEMPATEGKYPRLNALNDIYFCVNEFWKLQTGQLIFSSLQIDNGNRFLDMHMLLTYMTENPSTQVHLPEKHWFSAYRLVTLYFVIERLRIEHLPAVWFHDLVLLCNAAVPGYFGEDGPQPIEI